MKKGPLIYYLYQLRRFRNYCQAVAVAGILVSFLLFIATGFFAAIAFSLYLLGGYTTVGFFVYALVALLSILAARWVCAFFVRRLLAHGAAGVLAPPNWARSILSTKILYSLSLCLLPKNQRQEILDVIDKSGQKYFERLPKCFQRFVLLYKIVFVLRTAVLNKWTALIAILDPFEWFG